MSELGHLRRSLARIARQVSIRQRTLREPCSQRIDFEFNQRMGAPDSTAAQVTCRGDGEPCDGRWAIAGSQNWYWTFRALCPNWKLVVIALDSGPLAPVAVLSAVQLYGRQEELT